MLVITDGESDFKNLTIASANLAVQNGVRIFAVGVGNANRAELMGITGGKEENVFMLQQWDQLKMFVETLSIKLCFHH